MFFLAYVHVNIARAGVFPHHHAGVNGRAGPDEQPAALLCVVQPERHRLARLKGHQRAAGAHRQLAADRVELRALAGEPWVRFDRDSALDGVLLDVLRDHEPAPTTVARVSQTATAVRWAAHGLGATLVPASAVPHGQEHLARPLFPAVYQPVIAVLRHGAGPAETALLEFLRQETWSEPAFFSPVP